MQPRRNKNFSQLPSEPDIQRIQQVNWFGTDFSLLLVSCSELSTHIIMLPMRDRSSHIAPAECHDSCVPQCTNCGCGCGALQPSDWHKSFRMTWLCSSELEKKNLAVSGLASDGVLCGDALLTGPTWSLRSPCLRSRFRSTQTACNSTWTTRSKNWGGSSLSKTWWIP